MQNKKTNTNKQNLNERKVKALESIAESLCFLRNIAERVIQFPDDCDVGGDKEQSQDDKQQILLADPKKLSNKKRIGFNQND